MTTYYDDRYQPVEFKYSEWDSASKIREIILKHRNFAKTSDRVSRSAKEILSLPQAFVSDNFKLIAQSEGKNDSADATLVGSAEVKNFDRDQFANLNITEMNINSVLGNDGVTRTTGIATGFISVQKLNIHRTPVRCAVTGSD